MSEESKQKSTQARVFIHYTHMYDHTDDEADEADESDEAASWNIVYKYCAGDDNNVASSIPFEPATQSHPKNTKTLFVDSHFVDAQFTQRSYIW